MCGVLHATAVKVSLFEASCACLGIENSHKFQFQELKGGVDSAIGLQGQKISEFISFQLEVKVRIRKYQIIQTSQQLIIVDISIDHN